MSGEIKELGGMRMFETSNTNSRILLACLILGLTLIGVYSSYLGNQIYTLKQEVTVLQEQNLGSINDLNNSIADLNKSLIVCITDVNGNTQYNQKTGLPLCDSLRNFATGFYQEHQFALVDHRNAIIDLNRNVLGHEQVLVKIVGDLYQQPQEGVSE
ncbi:MAG TPA: hypothetical protein VMX17_06025 [Candidatus Glassbacteria bacterium]|nr:hypothetical protein [Candidatus Glassbacteria bacterium]